jgi:hypothetical protein
MPLYKGRKIAVPVEIQPPSTNASNYTDVIPPWPRILMTHGNASNSSLQWVETAVPYWTNVTMMPCLLFTSEMEYYYGESLAVAKEQDEAQVKDDNQFHTVFDQLIEDHDKYF